MKAALALLMFATLAHAASPAGPVTKCAPDAVVSGTVCMDKFEASVWRIPNPTTSNRGLVARIQAGKVTGAELAAAGAIQLGTSGYDYAPCGSNGDQCADVYAASIPFVTPARTLTWFQAQQACKNSRKRLPTNAEWQAAVAGTPDPGPDDKSTTCATDSFGTAATGTRSRCVSTDGAHDMVGNVAEWVADWVPLSSTCGTWDTWVTATGDTQCFAGAYTGSSGEPGGLMRGGSFTSGPTAGPLWVNGGTELSWTSAGVGFRCAR